MPREDVRPARARIPKLNRVVAREPELCKLQRLCIPGSILLQQASYTAARSPASLAHCKASIDTEISLDTIWKVQDLTIFSEDEIVQLH